jgi:hypothetical protein
MKTKTKAILTLMALPPLFTELMSGHTPASVFFQPIILLIMLFGYSLPILIIRELSVRWRLGLKGILMLGMAYGIFNEGIGAKTFLMNENLPVAVFDNYGYFFGINFPWSINIMISQAFISVLFPIIFVHYLYPNRQKEPWIGKKTGIALLMLSAVFGSAIFFGPYPFPVENPVFYFTIFTASILILIILAKLMPKSEGLKENKCGIKPVFFGVVFFFIYGLGPSLLAAGKVNLIIFYFFLVGILLLFTYILKTKNWLTTPALILFGVGVYILLGVAGTAKALEKGFPEGIITGIIFEIIFILAIIKIRKRSIQQKTNY